MYLLEKKNHMTRLQNYIESVPPSSGQYSGLYRNSQLS